MDRHGFTLIELLIVVGIIAILAVVLVYIINPGVLLQQSRDSRRISDINTIYLVAASVASNSGAALGTPDTVYVSIPDPLATSTTGDQCQGLGLGALPSGWSYHCASSSTYAKIDGTGWIPINLTSLSAPSGLSSWPIDPINQTSSFLYYTYVTDGTKYQITGHFESAKDQPLEAQTDGYDLAMYVKGTNVNLAPFVGGMTGYWPMDEGSGTVAYDYSGHGNNATLQGGTSWTTGKINGAVSFDGSSGTMSLAMDPFGTGAMTVNLWFIWSPPAVIMTDRSLAMTIQCVA